MASRSKISAFVLSTAVLAAFAGNASAVIDISKVSGPDAPSYRGTSSTTWFGWNGGSFDGVDNNNVLDNPAVTVGNLSLAGVGFVQNSAGTILSSGNNIYTAGNNLDATITAPTAGTPGTGFTTIIVQGSTAFSDFGSAVVFNPINGVTPSSTFGINSIGSGQFFVKYQIPGNAASYPVNFTTGTNLSLSNLQVDTQWSATGYASEFAVTPEPVSMAALGSALVGGLIRRRRSI